MISYARERILGLALAWAAGALLASMLCAPARAGCAHRIGSQAESILLPSILTDGTIEAIDERAGDTTPMPRPRAPKSCPGAFCNGGPVVPAAPSGVVRIGLETWACVSAAPDRIPAGPSWLITSTRSPRPIHRAGSVFHPPRPADPMV